MIAPRCLLVGATGQIGRQMLHRLGERALPTTRGTPEPGWLHLDLAEIQSEAQVDRILEADDLNAIYCLAGMTNVEACEDQQDLAFRTNASAPAALASYASRRQIPFVYFSTEYVFDGHAGPYIEEDPPNPLSVYGKSKWEGERAVRTAHPEPLIIRTTVVYGPDTVQKNFLYSLMRTLQQNKTMRVPSDQVSTPTYNVDLATVTQTLVERRASGVFHVCGPERMSRLELAQTLAAELKLDASLIHGVPTKLLGQRAPRPLDAGLKNGRLAHEHPDQVMRTCHQAIEDCRPLLEESLNM